MMDGCLSPFVMLYGSNAARASEAVPFLLVIASLVSCNDKGWKCFSYKPVG